ncbi:MAG: hypothetical protein AAGH89_10970 [Verrucomicrobiota bacterium]
MKRKLLTTTFSILALSLGGAIAEDDAKKKGDRTPPSAADRAAKFMESADKDGDGKLTIEELTAHFESMPAKKGKQGGGKPGGDKKGDKKTTS